MQKAKSLFKRIIWQLSKESNAKYYQEPNTEEGIEKVEALALKHKDNFQGLYISKSLIFYRIWPIYMESK